MTTEYDLPRESREFIGGLQVTVDGVEVSTFEVAVLRSGTRPVDADWTAPNLVDGKLGVLVGPGTDRPLGPGTYQLWVRCTDATESAVLPAVGRIFIR